MNEFPKEFAYDNLSVGQQALFTITITPELVDAFADLSGDYNPLHVDETYASETPFKHRIAHGAIISALFSRLIGMHLPGKYALYLSQTLQFHAPVALGTEIVIKGEITHKTDSHKTIMIHTVAENISTKETITSGDAMVKLLR